MALSQSEFFDSAFATAVPANPVFCHQEFLEKLAEHRNGPVARRAGLLMQRLAVDERRQHYKSTSGSNRGWRRSRLGGHQGSHFYAWWAPASAAPFRSALSFKDAPKGAIILRDIRHHDDHSAATAQNFAEHYLPVSVQDMRREEFGPAPWTPQQARFASSRQPVRILKGHPGSGKTTALLHAADASGASKVLYVTYSRELVTLARQHFDRYCSNQRRFDVVTFETLLRQLLDIDAPVSSFAAMRKRFRGDLVPFSRSLGAWTDREYALYDELHAHLAGAALPVALSRFAPAAGPRCPDKNYRERRIRYLGEGPANTALDLAGRLERGGTESLAARYFPELALAWQAASALAGKDGGRLAGRVLDADCIAVDECQDLTPLEAFVLIELAVKIAVLKCKPVSLFLAGDEAQTVRPTDFEWGWMNDLLHSLLGTPTEFKLASNLRSPRTIAYLVNRVWDLYSELGKRDRPSGTGYAEIADDATDQVLYCTATQGADLDALMTDLASREGLAVVAFDEQVRNLFPETVRPGVLSPSEVKGLDFHTVCVVNGGAQLEKIVNHDAYKPLSADIEAIRRRLAIDELRVALSRPAERLIWLDVNAPAKQVRSAIDFLSGAYLPHLSPLVPAAVMTALAEEQLDLEERIQRCQSDARQYLSVRPEMAWSRAQQAVALLGDWENPAAIRDGAARDAAWLTLAEVCFCLGFRNVHLPSELGRPDLFGTAATAARMAGRDGFAQIMRDSGAVCRAELNERLPALGTMVQTVARNAGEIESWFLTEVQPALGGWLQELEAALVVGNNSVTLSQILPPFYKAMRVPDAEDRTGRLLDRAVRHLVKNRRHQQALGILEWLPRRNPALEAECLEAVGEFRRAAELYRSLGKLKEALSCYRAIPDFEAAAGLISELATHPAAESYQWLLEMRKVVARRPANFNRVMQPSEKKILEEMLEQALGVARKKPAPRKTAARKTAAPKQPKS